MSGVLFALAEQMEAPPTDGRRLDAAGRLWREAINEGAFAGPQFVQLCWIFEESDASGTEMFHFAAKWLHANQKLHNLDVSALMPDSGLEDGVLFSSYAATNIPVIADLIRQQSLEQKETERISRKQVYSVLGITSGALRNKISAAKKSEYPAPEESGGSWAYSEVQPWLQRQFESKKFLFPLKYNDLLQQTKLSTM